MQDLSLLTGTWNARNQIDKKERAGDFAARMQVVFTHMLLFLLVIVLLTCSFDPRPHSILHVFLLRCGCSSL